MCPQGPTRVSLNAVLALALAAAMLALKYPDVAASLQEYRLEQALKVEEAHRAAGLSKLV